MFLIKRKFLISVGISILTFSIFASEKAIYKWEFKKSNEVNNKISSTVGNKNLDITTPRIKMTKNGLAFNRGSLILKPPFMPKKAISISTVIALRTVGPYGNFASYFQDNGNYEKGWGLGHFKNKFMFQIVTAGKFSTIVSKPFKLDKFYTVAGTYDGKEMKLYVNGEVVAKKNITGEIAYPDNGYFTIGSYKDANENFPIHGVMKELALYDVAISAEEIKKLKGAGEKLKKIKFVASNASLQIQEKTEPLKEPIYSEISEKEKINFTKTPNLIYLTHKSVKLDWESSDIGTFSVEITLNGKTKALKNIKKNGDNYSVIIPINIDHKIFTYVIKCKNDKKTLKTETLEFDIRHNYKTYSYAELNPSKKIKKITKPEILNPAKINNGNCLIIDIKSAKLATQIAKSTEFNVFATVANKALYQKLITELVKENIYGQRVSLFYVSKDDKLPFTSRSMNIILFEPSIKTISTKIEKEALKMLVPGTRGYAILKNSVFDSIKNDINAKVFSIKKVGDLVVIKKKEADTTGSWTHQYGTPGNTAASTEVIGPIVYGKTFTVKWFGLPGGSFGVDRNSRMPAPLALNGRLFHQGLNRFIALDSYNGTVIWEVELPYLRRLNIPRDGSNWCVNDNGLFVVVDNSVLKFDSESGHIKFHKLIPIKENRKYDWGYVAVNNNNLIGSTVPKKTIYKSFWTNKRWFDAKKGFGTRKVCSDRLFCLDTKDGKKKWIYKKGIIINSTISLTDNKVFFLEAKSKDSLAFFKKNAKMYDDELKDIHLMILNSNTGKVILDKKINIVLGNIVTYMQTTNNEIIITTSDIRDKNFHIYCFELNGIRRWENHNKWGKDHHSGHLYHPVLIKNILYLAPKAYDLQTGKTLSLKVPVGRGCSGYAGAADALFFRGGGRQIQAWSTKTGWSHGFRKLRPSCWMSILPANGMFLVPEGGGGCSCGGWIETSVGFSANEKE